MHLNAGQRAHLSPGPKRGRAAFVLTALLVLAFSAAHADLSTELVADGFTEPVFVTAAPGDESRLFVVERGGVIKIILTVDDTVLATPFMDISDLVATEDLQSTHGLAFHPEYASNGFVFIYYSNTSFQTVLARYQVSDNDPNVIDPASETVFLVVDQPDTSHEGGNPVFQPGDPNHYLFVGLGDGGNESDPDNPAQDVERILGSILRLDVDAGPGPDTATPIVPEDNPFNDGAGPNADAIWAFGIRAPWRISFDRLTGDLYIGDVGGTQREEIDFQDALSTGGENYGWKLLEGDADKECENCPLLDRGIICVDCDTAREITESPIHVLRHSNNALAIIGGYVYRGTDIPYLNGQYLFGDLNGEAYSFVFDPMQPYEDGVNPSQFTDRSFSINPNFLFGQLVSFGEDARGELYVVDLAGSVYRIVDRDRSLCTDAVDAQLELLALLDALGLEDADLDGDGLPEDAAIALQEYWACLYDEPGTIWRTLTEAYNENLETLAEEAEGQSVAAYARALAAIFAVNPGVQMSVLELLAAELGVSLGGEYGAVGCTLLGGCMSTTDEDYVFIFAGEGDMDGDLVSNADEYANVMSVGGSLETFVTAAYDPELNGSETGGDDGSDVSVSAGSSNCVVSLLLSQTPLRGRLNAIRATRDRHLLGNAAGTAVSDLYYRVSPALAARMRDGDTVAGRAFGLWAGIWGSSR